MKNDNEALLRQQKLIIVFYSCVITFPQNPKNYVGQLFFETHDAIILYYERHVVNQPLYNMMLLFNVVTTLLQGLI